MKLNAKQVAQILHKYWYWIDESSIFYGTSYRQTPGHLVITDSEYETYPSLDNFKENLSKIDVHQMQYRANIWDCENFGLRTYGEIRRQWVGEISPTLFCVFGKFNGRPHSINLTIIGDSWDNLSVYLVEPQLREKIWKPYVPPYEMQRDYYMFLNTINEGQIVPYIGGQIECLKPKYIKFTHPDMGDKWQIFTYYSQLLPELTEDRIKVLREHWKKLYNFELDYTTYQHGPWKKVRQEDRVFLVIA